MATAKTHPDNDPIAGEESNGESIWFYQCSSPLCNLRFPAPHRDNLVCPFCKSEINIKTPAAEFLAEQTHTDINRPKLDILLDNLRSAYNVGSILRTSDGAGVNHAYLCGITPTPLNSRLAKTALSAEIHTAWSHHPNGVNLAASLKLSGHRIIGLEISESSQNLFFEKQPLQENSVLVVGNEICGIDPEILKICNQVYAIPMLGKKDSLNVAVSFGIAAYYLTNNQPARLPVQSGNG